MSNVLTYYIANVPQTKIVSVLRAFSIPATVSPCLGVSDKWGDESSTAVMVAARPDEILDYHEIVAENILKPHGESSALIVEYGYAKLLQADGHVTGV